MNLTKDELVVYQTVALLADKHNCQYEIDIKRKVINFIGSIEDETKLEEELAIIFPKGTTI